MDMIEKIRDHLSHYDLDIRKTHNARFMDQKVTPDVLCFIADCIINYVTDDTSQEFTVRDIWNSQYFEDNVQAIFGKPSPSNGTASSEYDKFIGQPIKALDYAKILESEKRGTTYYYTVNNYEILEYISIKERYTFVFLYEYLVTVLSDSGFILYINRFENSFRSNRLSPSEFAQLKRRFQQFIRGNTLITGNTEINRIFPKVLNIISSMKQLPGSASGRLTNDIFHYTDLMYNRINWRDISKLKSLTRRAANMLSAINGQKKIHSKYLVQRAVNFIKKKYPQSELRDQWSQGVATCVHHIFPKSTYPQIAAYIENLIKLTSEQHFTKAHPNGNMTLIDLNYQCECLISKSNGIEESLNAGDLFYSKESFVYVVNTGLNTQWQPSMSFDNIRTRLVAKYNEL